MDFKSLKNNNTFKGVTYILGSNVVANVLQFVQFYILVKFYSQEEFGLWASLTSIAAILITGDFGITNILRNILSKERLNGAIGDEEARKYYFSAFISFFLFGLFVSIVLLSISPFIPYENLFETDNEFLRQQGRSIFIAIQIIFMMGIPFGMGLPMFFSYGENGTYAKISTAKAIITFLYVFLFAIFRVSIVVLAIGYFSLNLIYSAIGSFIFLKRRHWLRFDFSDLGIYRRMKEMLSTGIKFLGIQLSSSFVQNVLVIYSGSMVGLTTAANVSVINKIFTFFGAIYQSAFNPIWGKLTETYQKHDFKKCKEIINKTSLLTLVVFSFIIVGVLIFGQTLIDFVIGRGYSCTWNLVILIGLVYVLRLVFDNLSLLLNAISQLNVLLCIYLVSSAFVAYVTPKILNMWGFDAMAFSVVIMWLIAILIVYSYNRKILNQ